LSGILVIDDHPIIAKACRLVLEAADVGNIVTAHDAVSGYEAFLQHKPDVVIVDLSLHGERLSGLVLIERIRSHDPDARILVFSMYVDLGIFASAIEAGATGYLVKDASTDELAKAVQQVRSGHRYIDAQVVLKLAFPSTALAPREKQVLALLVESTPYATIARELGISHKTVVNVIYRVKRKLGVRGTSTLIRLGAELARTEL
jgi:DNA-binding NarL/FixJ family response regulator